MLGNLGWRWKQVPDFITDPNFGRDISREFDDINAKNCMQVGRVSEMIKDILVPECFEDNFPLILGGDHCISIGTISAIKQNRPNTVVVWVSRGTEGRSAFSVTVRL
jgi:arginase family enzyme